MTTAFFHHTSFSLSQVGNRKKCLGVFRSMVRLGGKTVLLTEADTGIGTEIALDMASRSQNQGSLLFLIVLWSFPLLSHILNFSSRGRSDSHLSRSDQMLSCHFHCHFQLPFPLRKRHCSDGKNWTMPVCSLSEILTQMLRRTRNLWISSLTMQVICSYSLSFNWLQQGYILLWILLRIILCHS